MKSIIKAVILLVICAAAGCVSVNRIYLSPSGSDNNPGTKAAPLATVQKALEVSAVDKVRPREIILLDGTYNITKPIEIDPAHSGLPEYPLNIRAANKGRAIISGGKQISGFKMTNTGCWVAHIPEAASGKWRFEQLFVDGRRATRAREPDKGFFQFSAVDEKVMKDGKGRLAEYAIQTLTVKDQPVLDILKQIGSKEVKDVQFNAYHKWDNTIRYLTGMDVTNGTFTIDGGGMKPWNPLTPETRFVLENFRAALDSPGEWFLSGEGCLYYKPLPGEVLDNAEVIAAVCDKLMVISGDVTNNRPVADMNIRDIIFKYAESVTYPEGFGPIQAAASLDAAVMLDGARNITFTGCDVSHIGKYAVWFRKGVRNCSVVSSSITDCGAGGIRIGEATIPASDNEATSSNKVHNTLINGVGRIYACAVGVLICHSGDNTVTHNDIGDLHYSGISAGWRWGYDVSPAKRNKINYNHIHHISGVLSDQGGVYTLGPSEGTEVSHNNIHDIDSYSYGGWGLYTDEGSTGIKMEKNLVYNTKTGAFHQHYGKNNLISNNIFAFSKLYQIQTTRVEDHLSFTFENNIICFTEGVLLQGPWAKFRTEMKNNCYWKIGGGEFNVAGMSFEKWQALGRDKGTVIADPMFIDAEKYDFRLKYSSPVFKTGFKRFDYSEAGLLK